MTRTISTQLIDGEIIDLFTPTNKKTTLTALRLTSTVTSLQSVGLPEISIEDTANEQLQKKLDLEWNSPRYQLNVYLKNATNYYLVGVLNLLNQLNIPYRNYDLIPLVSGKEILELGGNTTISVQIADVGFGMPSNSDSLIIYGVYEQESLFTNSFPFEINLSNSSQVILAENLQRKYAIITNDGDSKLYLNLGSEATLGQGIPLLPGGSFEITKEVDYKGEISAIADGNTIIVGLDSV